jgi:hypothetical protein
MTTWGPDAIIDLVFIILYSVLLVLNVLNVIKHGVRREGGYILLLVVSACTPPLLKRF